MQARGAPRSNGAGGGRSHRLDAAAAAAQKFSLHNNGVMGTRLLQLHADLRAAMAGGRRDPRADEGDGAIDGGDGSREAAFVRLPAQPR